MAALMQNLTAFLHHHATRRPDATALIYGDARISYLDLDDRLNLHQHIAKFVVKF
jgi:acyl-CoA synthetase (AMP-forming)/AMP-acid ligase II